jgi:enoyl-CoA hydratase/carnithine racemase
MASSGVGLRLEVGGAVARVVLDRPDRRNAQTPALWRALAALPDTLDREVRVVVLAADGPSFSAGLDLRMFTVDGIPGEPSFADLARARPADLDATIAGYQSAFSWLRDPRFVTVAAVQGHAVGAGFQLALACDLMLVAADAQLAIREPSLGLVPDLGGTQPLVERLGYGRALELCVTGRWMDAVEAVATGLALRSVPPEMLPAATDSLVAGLLTAPARAVAATKALLLGAAHRTYEQQLADERAAQAVRITDLAAAAVTASAQG